MSDFKNIEMLYQKEEREKKSQYGRLYLVGEEFTLSSLGQKIKNIDGECRIDLYQLVD